MILKQMFCCHNLYYMHFILFVELLHKIIIYLKGVNNVVFLGLKYCSTLKLHSPKCQRDPVYF